MKPGTVTQRQHRVGWHESQRYEEWDSSAIPLVDDGVPDEARGRLVRWWNETLAQTYGELDALYEAHPQLFLVHALRHALEAGGPLPISDEDWTALTAAPTAEELKAGTDGDARRSAIEALQQKARALREVLRDRIADAVDSGEADLMLPLSQAARESLQRTRHKDVLLDVLKAARTVSILTSQMDETASPARRAQWRRVLEEVDLALPFSRLPDAAAAASIAAAPLTAALTPGEIAHFDHFQTYDQAKQAAMENRDRTVTISAKRLPTPLAADAPNAFLEDAARVVDENPSLSASDKAYIMQHYTDALADRAEAWDISAEVKAIVEPQPQWGVYDPEFVKLQVRLPTQFAVCTFCVIRLCSYCELPTSFPLVSSFLTHP